MTPKQTFDTVWEPDSVDAYQDWCEEKWRYSNEGFVVDLMHASLGLSEESGEVVGKFKKIIRGDYGENIREIVQQNPERREAILKELGDLQYYLAMVSHLCGISLSEVFEANVVKLEDRYNRGVMQGEGDCR